MGSPFLEIKVSRMTLILNDPHTGRKIEMESAQFETPVQKNLSKKEARLVYFFIAVVFLVVVGAISFGTATMPQETTTPTTTTTTTTTVTYNTTTLDWRIPCPGNCFEEENQGWCNLTSGICTCNKEVENRFCGEDCNMMYQHCVNYNEENDGIV